MVGYWKVEMMRYYSKTTNNEVFEPSTDTIALGDGVIDWWFEALKDDEKVIYDNGMPYKYTQDFKKPVVDKNGVVVEGQTQAEAAEAHKQSEKARIQDEMNSLLDGMTPSETLILLMQYMGAKLSTDANDAPNAPSLTPDGRPILEWGDDISNQLINKLIQIRNL